MKFLTLLFSFLFVGVQADIAALRSVPSQDKRFQASADATDFSAYSSFRRVFGDDRLYTHFSSESDFHRSVRRATLGGSVSGPSPSRASSTSSARDAVDVAHNYLACGRYMHGRALKVLFESQEEVRSVSTVFTSQSEDKACFVVSTSAATLEHMDFAATPLL